MEPTLHDGDSVIVDRSAYRGRLPRPGDVVAARTAGPTSQLIVKRVHAVLSDGRIELLGDNADASTDSRQFGLIPATAIAGRVRWRYWPRPAPARSLDRQP